MHSTTSATDDIRRDDEAPTASVAGERDNAVATFASLGIAISEVQRVLDRLADGSGRRPGDAVWYARAAS
jgi:hypothetical protein